MRNPEKIVFDSLEYGTINEYDQDVYEILEQNKLLGYFKDTFPESFKSQWVLNLAYLELLNELKIPKSLNATILKGAHLITHIYPSEGQRFMGDLDLLVSKESIDEWKQFLLNIGFIDITGETWSANQFKSLFLKNHYGLELVVELHTRLFYQEMSGHKWETQPSAIEKFDYLKDEDLFVHLCGHLGYQHSFISLHWLLDIYLLLLKKVDFDWSSVKKKAIDAHVWRSCEIAIELVRNHFKLNIDLPFKPSIYTKLMTKVLINKKFLCRAQQTKYRYFFIKHFCKDSLIQAFIYDLKWWRHERKKAK